MDAIIIYAHNLFVRRSISACLASLDSVRCLSVSTPADVQTALASMEGPFFLSIVEAPLWNDSARADIALFNSRGIAPVILTNEFTETIRGEVKAGKIMDYILKDEHFTENLLHTVLRIRRNTAEKVLIVDDSPVSRARIKSILTLQKLNVIEACDGREGLSMFKNENGIRLILTDFNMQGMNGIELTRAIRKMQPKEKTAVIGFSDVDTPGLATRFLKNGANDFVFKSFIEEELYLRVMQNLETLRHMEELHRLSETDALTRLNNRRFFMEIGAKIFENVKRKNINAAVAMLDIDHFKHINDRYGHDIGDMVLRLTADVLSSCIRAGDIVCRYGGEEFCLITVNTDEKSALIVFDRIRSAIEEKKLVIEGASIGITVSIGATLNMAESLEKTISIADRLLYEAKAGGRNRVVVR